MTIDEAAELAMQELNEEYQRLEKQYDVYGDELQQRVEAEYEAKFREQEAKWDAAVLQIEQDYSKRLEDIVNNGINNRKSDLEKNKLEKSAIEEKRESFIQRLWTAKDVNRVAGVGQWQCGKYQCVGRRGTDDLSKRRVEREKPNGRRCIIARTIMCSGNYSNA
ncbi:hypothetical protein FACS189443_6530 [Planctomycetales bacterium]|nr:hypothetical protein FACS189443_6530 [Planctomycetales bacterium]